MSKNSKRPKLQITNNALWVWYAERQHGSLIVDSYSKKGQGFVFLKFGND